MARLKPGEMTGWQALAQIAWGTKQAAALFAGRQGEKLWKRALAGRYPTSLGPPRVAPAEAEKQLADAMRNGELTYRIDQPKSGFHNLTPAECNRRYNEGRTDEVFIKLSDVKRLFGLTDAQLLQYLQSGALIVHGMPYDKRDPNQGYYDLHVRFDQLAEFMVETGRHILNS